MNKFLIVSIFLISSLSGAFAYYHFDVKPLRGFGQETVYGLGESEKVRYYLPLKYDKNKVSIFEEEYLIESKAEHFHFNESGLIRLRKDYSNDYEMFSRDENKNSFFRFSAIFVTEKDIEDTNDMRVAKINKMMVELTDELMEQYDLFFYQLSNRLLKRLDQDLLDKKVTVGKSNEILEYSKYYLLDKKRNNKDLLVAKISNDYFNVIEKAKETKLNKRFSYVFYINEKLEYTSLYSDKDSGFYKVYTTRLDTFDYFYNDLKKAIKEEKGYLV